MWCVRKGVARRLRIHDGIHGQPLDFGILLRCVDEEAGIVPRDINARNVLAIRIIQLKGLQQVNRSKTGGLAAERKKEPFKKASTSSGTLARPFAMQFSS